MSEYRSALRAARERIEQLEARLPPPPAPVRERFSPLRVLALLGASLPLLAVFTAALLVARASMFGAPVVILVPSPRPPPPAPPAAPRITPTGAEGLAWYPQTGVSTSNPGPFVTSIDGAPPVIIGLTWDLGREIDGLHVIALDQATLQLRWRAGPYPSVWARDGHQGQHLAVSGDRAVVSDAHGHLHFLDARTGEERATKTLTNQAVDMCLTNDGARMILPLDPGWRARGPDDHMGDSLFAWEHNKTTLVLDPRTGKTAEAPRFAVCERDRYCAFGRNGGCRGLEVASTPEGKLHISGREVWRSDDLRVTLGTSDGDRFSAIAWDARTRTALWETLLVSDADQTRGDAGSWAALEGSRFLFAFATKAGPHRLMGLDARTGQRRFEVPIEGSSIGTRMHDVSARGGDVFVMMNEELQIFDAADGKRRGRLGPL